MEGTHLNRLQLGKKIGGGGCGSVFQAIDEGGKPVALKVFDQKAISRDLLQRMTARLEVGGWPDGVMPISSAEYGEAQTSWVMPLLGAIAAEEDAKLYSLQQVIHDYPKEDAWKLIKSLAQALAAMHQRRVAHGNLKPGNVFLNESGGVLISDWAMGNMPGVQHFTFTDAVLYQPPEQLQDPAGYLMEAGYRWDVFSFGVIAYRILTGQFPRSHDTFNLVVPLPGETRREGIQADLTKVSRNLESQPQTSWPAPCGSELETKQRELIDQCLDLDPAKRPYSMMEVARDFDEIKDTSQSDALLDQPRETEKKAKSFLWIALLSIAAAVGIGGLWQYSNQRQKIILSEQETKNLTLQAELNQAKEAEKFAEDQVLKTNTALEYEKDLSISRLEASRSIGDHLFAWAMEKGNRRLPPLDGRELRLKRLERYFEDFLSRTSEIQDLTDERANVRLQLSEIALAGDDPALAASRLQEAMVAWKDLPMDGELRLRLAKNSLLLALLRQSLAQPEAKNDFIVARDALQAIPESEGDGVRLAQLLAVLDFHEAKLFAANGEDAKALSQLLRATKSLNKIADLQPDLAILRSELAACYLSSATILEGMGSLGDAREVRALATTELSKLLNEDPTNYAIRLELAGSYTAMAESATLSGDIAAAENNANLAMALLDELLVSQPDNVQAVARKATLLGLRAGVLRDKGFAEEAMNGYNEGIRILQAAKASTPQNAMVSFRLAMLWWQKGRMIGISGDRSGEIALIQKARDLLGKLEADPSLMGPRPEQLQNSGAYLLGDLGHALQLDNQKEEAIKAFSDAAALWENMLVSRPLSEEYSEGLAWSLQRLKDLK